MSFMAKTKLSKSQLLCTVAIVITVAAQALEKILEVAIQPSQISALVCAMVYTIAVACVYFLISKSTNTFWGLLASLLAFKMMPPKINYILNVTVDGGMLYFIVQKVAILLFLVLAYRFYRAQEKQHCVNIIPVFILAAAVPFFNEISAFVDNYFLYKTGSMILPFLTNYACYTLAVVTALAVAFISGKESMKFAAFYEFCALGINMFRQIGKIGYFITTNQHVSKSFYGWIAVLAVLMVVTAVLLKKSNSRADSVGEPALAEE